MITKTWIFAAFTIFFLFSTRQALAQPERETATFAGGCFWCMEHPFDQLKGVDEVLSGYTGGTTTNPTYEDVSTGTTGHLEAAQITFDPQRIKYTKLLDLFWRQIDPTDAGGQFVDRGTQYTTAIFYHSEAQRLAAEKSRAELGKSRRFSRPAFYSGG
ncbi:MAG: peptide-methionine (S)-S-oxide reductase MsrA [Deltaproteobacteria bacterium]|nr:peptide-methionine (S)-S-oxide reductase MsrA [Deltaproteobacteria bacterium]